MDYYKVTWNIWSGLKGASNNGMQLKHHLLNFLFLNYLWTLIGTYHKKELIWKLIIAKMEEIESVENEDMVIYR